MTDYRYDEQCQVHVPNIVLQRQFTAVEEMNRSLATQILEMADRERDTDRNAVNSGLISTQGGYQTSTDFNLFQTEDPTIRGFVDQMLMPSVTAFLKRTFGDEGAALTPWPIGWSNVLEAGDWQGPHCHPTPSNLASGVYYVRIPENKPAPQGCIEFMNPIPQSMQHGHPATRRLHPVEGLMILFPPWYNHYVHPFEGDGTRIIIAFDILAKPPKPQFVF